MIVVELPYIGLWEHWRKAARNLASEGILPDSVDWRMHHETDDLFSTLHTTGHNRKHPATTGKLTVSSAFLSSSRLAIHHSDPGRFNLLYRLLLRLQKERHLLKDGTDRDVSKLTALVKAVRRDAHKMKAFVRFRDIGVSDSGRRQFGAWFEPSHHVLEPAAPFFARRYTDMDWTICTPNAAAIYKNGTLEFSTGILKPDWPQDETETLWKTYFANIFNPARLKIKAMSAEMPKKYWRNLPEAALIPDMIRQAENREKQMLAAHPMAAQPATEKWKIAARPKSDTDKAKSAHDRSLLINDLRQAQAYAGSIKGSPSGTACSDTAEPRKTGEEYGR